MAIYISIFWDLSVDSTVVKTKQGHLAEGGYGTHVVNHPKFCGCIFLSEKSLSFLNKYCKRLGKSIWLLIPNTRKMSWTYWMVTIGKVNKRSDNKDFSKIPSMMKLRGQNVWRSPKAINPFDTENAFFAPLWMCNFLIFRVHGILQNPPHTQTHQITWNVQQIEEKCPFMF